MDKLLADHLAHWGHEQQVLGIAIQALETKIRSLRDIWTKYDELIRGAQKTVMAEKAIREAGERSASLRSLLITSPLIIDDAAKAAKSGEEEGQIPF